jgi:hypothetical protein
MLCFWTQRGINMTYAEAIVVLGRSRDHADTVVIEAAKVVLMAPYSDEIADERARRALDNIRARLWLKEEREADQ